jgi:hypothetical protein
MSPLTSILLGLSQRAIPIIVQKTSSFSILPTTQNPSEFNLEKKSFSTIKSSNLKKRIF